MRLRRTITLSLTLLKIVEHMLLLKPRLYEAWLVCSLEQKNLLEYCSLVKSIPRTGREPLVVRQSAPHRIAVGCS